MTLNPGTVLPIGEQIEVSPVFINRRCLKDGVFVQQAIFNGDPFEQQVSPESESVHLVAEQTISISPGNSSPLSFRANTEHDVTVTRSGKDLTLVFGFGTVQEFARIGSGGGEIYSLQDGALAFADNYLILVQGDEKAVTTAYGTFDKQGDKLHLNVVTWAQAGDSGATNQPDIVMHANFDGPSLTLADSRSFRANP